MRTLVVNALRMSGNRTGVGRHVQFMAEQWSRMPLPFDRVVFVSPRELHLERTGTTTPIDLLSAGGRWPYFGWEQFALPQLAKHAALLFCPAYAGPILYRGRMVVANHGIYEGIPGEFSWWTRLRGIPVARASARRAHRVIANSRSTKSDLVKYFGVAESKIEVVYPAAHDIFFAPHSPDAVAADVRRVVGGDVPYVIFVGKLSRRRHVPNLIEAFAIVRKRAKLPHRLLIVGPNAGGIPLRELATQAGIADAVIYCPFLEQEPLARLYAGADLFVLPTTHEGISYTMFEAMASGTAVLTVEHPTLSEGAGEAAYAVPTPAVNDLVRGLTLLLMDAALRRRYEEQGRARAAAFSWTEAARATMAILDRVGFSSDNAAAVSLSRA